MLLRIINLIDLQIVVNHIAQILYNYTQNSAHSFLAGKIQGDVDKLSLAELLLHHVVPKILNNTKPCQVVIDLIKVCFEVGKSVRVVEDG